MFKYLVVFSSETTKKISDSAAYKKRWQSLVKAYVVKFINSKPNLNRRLAILPNQTNRSKQKQKYFYLFNESIYMLTLLFFNYSILCLILTALQTGTLYKICVVIFCPLEKFFRFAKQQIFLYRPAWEFSMLLPLTFF